MQLTQYTDYGLRVLIALAVVAPQATRSATLADAYGISRHHLTKVVQGLAALGYVETLRGKAGGVRLARDPKTIRLGRVIAELEPELGLVECLRERGGRCVIEPACVLKGVLRQATSAFLADLDARTLADLIPPGGSVARLLGVPTLMRGSAAASALKRGVAGG